MSRNKEHIHQARKESESFPGGMDLIITDFFRWESSRNVTVYGNVTLAFAMGLFRRVGSVGFPTDGHFSTLRSDQPF